MSRRLSSTSSAVICAWPAASLRSFSSLQNRLRREGSTSISAIASAPTSFAGPPPDQAHDSARHLLADDAAAGLDHRLERLPTLQPRQPEAVATERGSAGAEHLQRRQKILAHRDHDTVIVAVEDVTRDLAWRTFEARLDGGRRPVLHQVGELAEKDLAIGLALIEPEREELLELVEHDHRDDGLAAAVDQRELAAVEVFPQRLLRLDAPGGIETGIVDCTVEQELDLVGRRQRFQVKPAAPEPADSRSRAAAEKARPVAARSCRGRILRTAAC